MRPAHDAVDVTSPYHQQRREWIKRYDDATTMADIYAVCQDICNLVDRKAGSRCSSAAPDVPVVNGTPEWGTRIHLNNELILRMKCTLVCTRTTFAQRKIVAKSYYKLYQHNYRYCQLIFPFGGLLGNDDPADDAVAIYGMVHSGFLALADRECLTMVPERNYELFQTMGCYQRWFNTVAESMLALQRLEPLDAFFRCRLERIWHIILLNLESPYHGTREQMLALLKHLAAEDKFVRGTVIPSVARWSWMNRNKYHVLLILLTTYRLQTIEEVAGGQLEIIDALRLSLKYKHLFSGGQGLVRVLQKQKHHVREGEEIYRLIVSILQESPIEEVQNMIKQWFSTLSPKNYRQIYELLLLDQLTIGENREQLPLYMKANGYAKFFLVMNLFRREFQSNKNLNLLLVLMLQLSDETKLDHTSMTLLVETLVHHIIVPSANIHPSTSVFHIFKLKEYIIRHIGIVSTNVCNTFVAQTRKLLHHIATLPLEDYERNVEAYGIVSELMGSYIFHHYLRCQTSYNYHTTLTALRMFATFAELFLDFRAARYLPRPKVTAESLAHMLPVRPEAFHAMVHSIEHLLTAEYDDVRNVALKFLYNKPAAFHYGKKLQTLLSKVYSSADPTVILQSMTVVYDDSRAALKKSLSDHRQDFFGMLRFNFRIHNQLDAINEAFFGYEEARTMRILDRIPGFERLLLLVNRIVEFALDALNGAKTVTERTQIGTSFEIMDRSLQLLLDRSAQTSTGVVLDKKRMQAALWQTLRSSSALMENYVLWVLDNYQRRHDTLATVSLCLRAYATIMLNCCHRGAIETTGVSFGRVIKRIAALKERLVAADDRRNRHARTIVDLADRFFRGLLAMQLDEHDFRRCRGYLFLIHNYIRNDAYSNADRCYLRTYVRYHQLPLGITVATGSGSSFGCITVLQLHQLNLLVREANLNNTMLEYIDDLMIVALERFKSTDWACRNAALQLYASIVTKLVGQRQQCTDGECDWPPAYVSFDEIVYKLTKSNKYILRELRNERDRVPTPFLILVFEFLSKLEYRAYHIPGQKSIAVDYRAVLWRYLKHENDQVRTLAATCFTQLHDYHDEIPRLLPNLVACLFAASHCNENFRHGLCLTVHGMVRKCVTQGRHTGAPGARMAHLERMRHLVLYHQTAMLNDTAAITSSYRFRCAMLELLIYLGFDKQDPIVTRLIFNQLAPNDHGLFVFLMKTNRAYNDGGVHNATGERDYEVMIGGQTATPDGEDDGGDGDDDGVGRVRESTAIPDS